MLISPSLCCSRNRLDGSDEIDGNEATALVEQLIKRVLGVVAGLAPDDVAAGDPKGLPTLADAFAVALHVHLLQECGESPQSRVVGQYGLAACAEKVVVPDRQQREQHGQIFGRRGPAKMAVHGPPTCKEGTEIFHAKPQGDGESHRRPHRVPAADPIPEAEAIVRMNAKSVHRLMIGGYGSKISGHGLFTDRLEEPVARRPSVGQRLLGSEGL